MDLASDEPPMDNMASVWTLYEPLLLDGFRGGHVSVHVAAKHTLHTFMLQTFIGNGISLGNPFCSIQTMPLVFIACS